MTKLTGTDQNLVRQWDQRGEAAVGISLVRPEDTDTGPSHADPIKQFQAVADQLTGLSPRLAIRHQSKPVLRPGFELAGNILFSALPLQKGLPPFLNALSQTAGSRPVLPDPVKNRIDRLDIPIRLKLYITPACPHCPDMVNTLIPIALSSSLIQLEILDGSLFNREAQKDRVASAPCLILDDDFRWTGGVTALEILKMAVSRDPSTLSTATLKHIMEEGDASWIAGQMAEKKKIFDNFVHLICYPLWSVRLGAMVVVEELAQTHPDLILQLCPPLIDQFDSVDIPAQGDILYALGEAGDLKTADWIEKKLPSFSHPDLIDAANEAIASIRMETD